MMDVEGVDILESHASQVEGHRARAFESDRAFFGLEPENCCPRLSRAGLSPRFSGRAFVDPA